jgi:DNA-binding transcriptional regulator GbsR (MarR family)
VTKAPPRVEDARRRFVEDISHLYAHYGLALTVGRVFGLLLVSDDPLSLDDLAEQLGTPGSRRVLYEANDSMEPIFEGQFDRIRGTLGTLRRADAALAPGQAKARMREMIELHEFWLRESEGIMDRWRRRSEA